MILLLAFIIVPIVEVALLIKVGGWIGGWETIGLIILTAAIGTALFRAQGFSVLARAQDVLARGGFPAEELFDGICILIAGVLLLTPGFVTDGLGLMLLVPGLRNVIAGLLWRSLQRSGQFEMHVGGTGFARPRHMQDDDVIEGEYREVRPEKPDRGATRIGDPPSPDSKG